MIRDFDGSQSICRIGGDIGKQSHSAFIKIKVPISPITRHGLRRQYAPETLLQLGIISLGKSAGFTLSEISGMFRKDGTPDLPRKALAAKADELELQIRKLSALRGLLQHVAECPARTHLECPKFRRLLRIAMRRKTA